MTPPLVNCVQINNVGGVDETWYNPGDNKYYLAARDMLPSAVMGVIDAGTNQWLFNMPDWLQFTQRRRSTPRTTMLLCRLQAGAVCTTLESVRVRRSRRRTVRKRIARWYSCLRRGSRASAFRVGNWK